MNEQQKLTLLFVIIAIAIMAAVIAGPIPQDPGYHSFADQRVIFGIPNFWNVVTNIPLIIVGIMGMMLLARGNASGGLPELSFIYFLFFCGLFATGIGSMYYHYSPANQTLLWDRLPMTIFFMAFFSAIVGENISPRAGRTIVLPLIALGIASVLYWYLIEAKGNGDLRWYALVQFLPLVLVPVILLLFRSKVKPTAYLWAVLGAYALAKIAESFDRPIFTAMPVLSGHSWKHLIAALGAYLYYLALRRRKSDV